MPDNLVELHGRCGRRFAEFVAGVRAQQWHDDTPCSEWDVRELVFQFQDQKVVENFARDVMPALRG